MRRGCAHSCKLFSQFTMAIFNLLVSSARALSAPVFSFKKQPHISKDMAAHFPILRPEVLEACHNLPLNLTVFGPRGTNWSVSWTSGKCKPPFRTEDNAFSIVLKRGKEDEKKYSVELSMASADPSSSAPSSRRRSCSAIKSDTGMTRSASRWMARPSLVKECILQNVHAVRSGEPMFWKNLRCLCKPCTEPAILLFEHISPML